MNICPLCVEEQADPKHKNYRDRDTRKPNLLPCLIHGDPRFCLPENQEALKIYHYLHNNHIGKEYKQGEKVVGKWVIDMQLALMLCQAFEVEDVPDMLEKLEAIHQEYYP